MLLGLAVLGLLPLSHELPVLRLLPRVRRYGPLRLRGHGRWLRVLTADSAHRSSHLEPRPALLAVAVSLAVGGLMAGAAMGSQVTATAFIAGAVIAALAQQTLP